MITETKKGFKCCAERHLIKTALGMAVYNKIGALTQGGKKGGTYFGTLEALADLFGCAPNSVWRVVKQLVTLGFLERLDITDGSEYQLRAICFQSKNYRYVAHEEWATKNPGECYEAIHMPWDGLDGDSLARRLWTVSNGNTRWYPGQLVCLRKAGRSDDEVVQQWAAHISRLEKPCVYRGQWKSEQGRFLRWVKQLQPQIDTVSVDTLAAV